MFVKQDWKSVALSSVTGINRCSLTIVCSLLSFVRDSTCVSLENSIISPASFFPREYSISYCILKVKRLRNRKVGRIEIGLSKGSAALVHRQRATYKLTYFVVAGMIRVSPSLD